MYLLHYVLFQIALALQHCHLLNIAHRDLKPENLLFKDNSLVSWLAFSILVLPLSTQFRNGCIGVYMLGALWIHGEEALDQVLQAVYVSHLFPCWRLREIVPSSWPWSFWVILICICRTKILDNVWKYFGKGQESIWYKILLWNLIVVFIVNPDKICFLPHPLPPASCPTK